MKGATRSAYWYVSLDFVPHLDGRRMALHRTDRSVRPDLRYDPWDHDSADWRGRRPWQVSVLSPAPNVRRDIAAMTDWTARRAGAWFDAVRTIHELRAAFARAETLPTMRFGFDNYPQQRLA